MSISWRVERQNVVYPSNGIAFAHRKERSTFCTCYNMDKP